MDAVDAVRHGAQRVKKSRLRLLSPLRLLSRRAYRRIAPSPFRLLWRVGSRFRFLRSGGVSKIKRQPDQGDAGSYTEDI